jgi:hypothetical protein
VIFRLNLLNLIFIFTVSHRRNVTRRRVDLDLAIRDGVIEQEFHRYAVLNLKQYSLSLTVVTFFNYCYYFSLILLKVNKTGLSDWTEWDFRTQIKYPEDKNMTLYFSLLVPLTSIFFLSNFLSYLQQCMVGLNTKTNG